MASVVCRCVMPSGASKEVVIGVASPEPHGRFEFSCLVSLPDREEPFGIFGVDSLQSLALGMRFASARIQDLVAKGWSFFARDGDEEYEIDWSAYFMPRSGTEGPRDMAWRDRSPSQAGQNAGSTPRSVVKTYLEMRDPGQLLPKRSSDPRFRVLEASARQWELNRFLYRWVGSDWSWTDKLSWTDERWMSYVRCESLRTFVGYRDGSPVGYFELLAEGGEVEIAYFGLVPSFIGQGLGGVLLTCAIEEAWRLGPSRVRVHTCTLDHPAALPNYLSRGMTVFRTETLAADGGGEPRDRRRLQGSRPRASGTGG